ncbi:phage tail tape measure protein [Deinococcus apachensis]|uniref:phage tail tape measure protein n=1 Tax=Deinococcus apachensis TaxID=309886 RepID=UPI00036A6B9B|nr:phage tail tape measure protein [Deinococcus apachensis]
MPNIGEITAEVALLLPDAEVKRALDRAEAGFKGRLTLPASLDTTGISAGLKSVRADLDALTGQGVKASREQAAASKSLEAQYRATGAAQAAAARTATAESQANAAKLREQAAQLTLTTRLSAQADREAAQAGRAAFAARREEIDRLKLAYSRLRAEFDAGETDLAGFNMRGQQIINTLKLMGERADFTTRELKQLADLQGRVEREQNTAAGVLNPVSFSGNVAVGLQNVLPGLLGGLRQVAALSPSLGAAAAQISGIGQALQTVRVAAQGAVPHTIQVGQGLNTAGQAAGFLRTGMTGAGTALNGVGVAAGFAGAALGVVAVAAAATGAAINKAVNEYAQFERGLAQVATLTDKTTQQLGETGRAVLKLSADTGASFTDLNRGLYDVLGAGVKGTEDLTASLNLLRQATLLARAGATDTATATDVLTSVLNAYKLTASDAGRVSDQLFQAVKDGKVTFDQLARSLGAVLPVAAQAGVGLDEVLAAVAALTAQGVQPGAAVEYLRSAISNIIKPSEQAAGLASDLKLQFNAQALAAKGLKGFLEDVARATGNSSDKMAILFGDVGGLTAATALANGNFERFNQTLTGQAQSAGATSEAYGKMAATIDETTNRVTAKWKALWVSVGELFAPTKLAVLQGIEEMLNRADALLSKFLKVRELNGIGNQILNAERQLDGDRQALAIGKKQLADQGPQMSQATRLEIQTRLNGLEASIRAQEGRLAELRRTQAQIEADNRSSATSNLQPGQAGPREPGDKTADPTGYDAPTNSTEYQSAVAMQALRQTGLKTADMVVNYCAQWVRLTLGKADERAAPFINKLFQTDSNRDGQTDARDAARNAKAAGLLRSYSGVQDLKPGDTVFYTENGQNHVGIYIGGGMVRGNNRVTYQENGGRFGPGGVRSGEALDAGRVNPVGNVAIDRLGRVTGYVSASDLGRAAGVTEGRPTPRPTTPPPPDDKDGPITAAQIIRAQQLTAALEKAQEALKKNPKSIPLTQALDAATVAVQNFEKASDGNARAIARVRDAQGGLKKSTGEYIATQQDLNRYGNDALRLLKAQEQAYATGSAAQRAAADRNLAIWVGDSKARAAVVQVEKAAYEDRKQAADRANRDADTAAKNRLKTQQDLQQALNTGREGDARRYLDSLKQQQATALDLARDNAAQRAKIIEQTGPAIIAAENRLANLQRDQRVKAAQQAADEAKKLPGADLVAIEKTRVAAVAEAYKAAAAQRSKARQDQAAAERAADRTLADDQERRDREAAQRRAAVAEAARQGNITLAEQELAKLQQMRENDLRKARDNAQQRLTVEKRYAEQIYQAEKAVADRRLRDAQGDADRGPAQERAQARLIAQRAYDAALLKAQSDRDGRVEAAEKAAHERTLAREKEQAQLRARVADERRKQSIQAAQDDLARTQELNKQELDAFRGTAAQRLALIKRQAEDEYQARLAVARATQQQALAAAANGPAQFRQGAQDAANRTYTQAELTARGQRDAAVRQATEGIEQEAEAVSNLQKRYEGLTDTFMQKSLSGTLTEADVTSFWSDLGDALDDAKKAGLDLNPVIVRLRDQARDLAREAPGVQAWAAAFKQAQDVATTRYGGDAATDFSFRQRYGGGDEGLLRSLSAATGFSIVKIRDDVEVALTEARRLAPETATIIERTYADALAHRREVGAAEREEAEATARADQEAYVSTKQFILDNLQTQSEQGLLRIYDEAVADRDQDLIAAVFGEWERRRQEAERQQQVIFQIQADANTALAEGAKKTADELAQAGDSDGALAVLEGALSDVMDAAARGEDAADAINDLTGTSALTDEFNSFVATLSGTLDEQIGQVMTRLEEITDPAMRARLRGLLTDLRGQMPTYDDSYKTGYVPGPNGFVNRGGDGSTASLDEIATARDLTTRLAGPTDPDAPLQTAAEVQGLMVEASTLLASEVGQRLPPSVRQALEEGVSSAQAYLDALGTITEEGITDGWERATKNVPSLPGNEFTDWADKIFALGRAGLGDPIQKNALVESLQQAREQSRLTEVDLQNLLALIDEFSRDPEPEAVGNAFDLTQWQQGVQELTDWFDSGKIGAQEYTEGLHNAASELNEMAAAAEAAGNIPLAQRLRELAVSLRALNPEIARTLRTLGKVQEYAGYVQDLAGAFGQLAEVVGGSDLAANLNGLGNLAGKVGALVGDVARIIANPLDIGAWVGAVTKVISGIAEALGGFRKARAEAKRMQEDFNEQFTFINGDDFAKTFVRSRGWLADTFGGGPEVKQEVDKLGLLFAKSLEAGFSGGIKDGLKNAILKNDFSIFSKTLREQVFDGLLGGVTDLFLNETLLKNIIGPAIKAWSDALKTPDTADDAAALAGIDAAISQVDQLGQRFYTDVAPKLQGIGQRWGIGADGQSGSPSGNLIGNAPGMQLGIPRFELTLPADALTGLRNLAGWDVGLQNRANQSLIALADYVMRAQRPGQGGPPALSGLGPLQ